MATKQQEKIYNQIVKYFDYSDELISLVEEASHDFSDKQFQIVENGVEKLEKYTDDLAAQYIDFIQHGDSAENTNQIKKTFHDILVTIEECRNKINMLYFEKTQ